MQRIINSRTKKARAKQELKEKRKVQWYARKVIHFLSKQYKKTGNTVIDIDVYKFNEDKLVKVLQMLQSEKQVTYIKSDDLYTVTIILPKTTLKNHKKRLKHQKKQKRQKNHLKNLRPERFLMLLTKKNTSRFNQ